MLFGQALVVYSMQVMVNPYRTNVENRVSS